MEIIRMLLSKVSLHALSRLPRANANSSPMHPRGCRTIVCVCACKRVSCRIYLPTVNSGAIATGCGRSSRPAPGSGSVPPIASTPETTILLQSAFQDPQRLFCRGVSRNANPGGTTRRRWSAPGGVGALAEVIASRASAVRATRPSVAPSTTQGAKRLGR